MAITNYYRFLNAAGNPDTTALSSNIGGCWNKVSLIGLFTTFASGPTNEPYTLRNNAGPVPDDVLLPFNMGETMSFVVDFTGATNDGKIEIGMFDVVTTAIVQVSIDGGAWTVINGVNAGAMAYVTLATGLSGGTHHVRVHIYGQGSTETQFFSGFKLSTATGATATIVSTAHPFIPAAPQPSASVAGGGTGNPFFTTAAAFRGAFYNNAGTPASLVSNVYGSGIVEFAVTNCTAVDGFGLNGSAGQYAVGLATTSANGQRSQDTDFNKRIIAMQGAGGTNYLPYPMFSVGATSGSSWNVTYKDIGGGNDALYGFTLYNGDITTARAAAAATTLAVTTGSKFVANDWIVVGTGNRRSFCKVASVSVNTLTLASPGLAYDYDVGARVVNEREGTTPTASAWSSFTPAKVGVFVGDSTTHSNDGTSLLNLVPGIEPVRYTFDFRSSWARYLCDWLGWQDVNLGIQGNTVADMVNRVCTAAHGVSGVNGAIGTATASNDFGKFNVSADYCFLFAGVNNAKVGSGVVASGASGAQVNAATFQAQYEQIIADAWTAYGGKAGFKIYCMGLITPLYAQAPTGGEYTVTQVNTRIQAAVTHQAGLGVTVSYLDVSKNIDTASGSLHIYGDGLHYKPAGYQAIANNVAAALGLTPIGGGSGGGGGGGGGASAIISIGRVF